MLFEIVQTILTVNNSIHAKETFKARDFTLKSMRIMPKKRNPSLKNAGFFAIRTASNISAAISLMTYN